jgi:hypothetical protein
MGMAATLPTIGFNRGGPQIAPPISSWSDGVQFFTNLEVEGDHRGGVATGSASGTEARSRPSWW